MVRYIALVLALGLAVPAQAQDSPPADEGLFALMERLLREFMTDAEPQLRELEGNLSDSLSDLEPELNAFLDRMRDMTRYHPPEVLPNGDILIRRRQPVEGAPEEDAPSAPPSDPLEL